MNRKTKNFFHLLSAIKANLIYGFPSKKLILIGITGTDGKTTTSHMVYHILKSLKFKVGLITTVSIDIGRGIKINTEHSTTPGCYQVQKLLREATSNHLNYMIIESSSHGLDQHRVWGCHFRVGAITNLTPEHLDYHQTMEKYLCSKAKLFQKSDSAIFNLDDSSYPTLKQKFPKHSSYSLKNNQADFNLQNTHLKLNVLGKYNLQNGLAAIAIVGKLGIKTQKAVQALKTFTLPLGRLEIIQETPFRVINDFAHTPNGLKNLLPSLEKQKGSKLIHVFGCPGKRDKSKRSPMGKISSDYAHIIILTAEDPRDENIKQINQDIKSEIPKSFKGEILEIEDRDLAIKKAISLAKAGDTVLFTGKGPEPTQELKDKTLKWNETQTIKKYLPHHFK